MTWKDWSEKDPRDHRDDLIMAYHFEQAGWTLEFSYNDKRFKRTTPDDIPHDGINFIKGNIHVWQARHGYQVAELIDGRFTNHRGSWGVSKPYISRFPATLGFIPDLQTVLELDKKGEL